MVLLIHITTLLNLDTADLVSITAVIDPSENFCGRYLSR